eukprot:5790137-Pyramimonas_sp.AAC.1
MSWQVYGTRTLLSLGFDCWEFFDYDTCQQSKGRQVEKSVVGVTLTIGKLTVDYQPPIPN